MAEDEWVIVGRRLLRNRCTKELNQWDHLLDYTQTKNLSNPVLILESAWRVPDWSLMKETLSQVDLAYPGILSWKVRQRGYACEGSKG